MNRRRRGTPLSDRSGAPRKELKYYGRAACLALWQRRPQDVIRIYLEQEAVAKFSAMLKWAAEKHKAYHVVTAEDVERLTQSIHHQGICVVAKEHPTLAFAEWLPLIRDEAAAWLLVYLDGVENPHNLGAILRSCAHFGVRYVLGAEKRLPKLSPSACRVAEGGAEEVMLVYLNQPGNQMSRLRELGFELLAAVAGKGASLYRHGFRERSVLILGNEMEGIAPALLHITDTLLHIPGSGKVESLNVSVACGVIAGEYYRQRGPGLPNKPTGGQRRK
jgi:RNA methyltransferase, TrmH family